MSGSRREPMHVVVMGVSATGKTTVAEELAEELGCEFIEGDDLHPAANIEKMSEGIPLTDEDRWPWLQAIAELVAVKDRRGYVDRRHLLGAEAGLPRRAARRGADVLRAPRRAVRGAASSGCSSAPSTSCRPACCSRSSTPSSSSTTTRPGRVVDVTPPLDEVVEEAVNAVRVHYTE